LTFAGGRIERAGSTALSVRDEETFYRLLELPYIPPELREGEDEIAAAERGALPSLINALHIRGDLHMHSTWSDGRDTILHMALSARQLGYEYVAITDHSERSWASRKLLAVEIPLQREEIEAARSQASGIEILHGVEVDIMPDGSLDFDDDTLARFDIVLASLHDAAGDDGARLTERYLGAMRNPLVKPPLNRARLWRSMARRVISTWTAGSPGRRRLPASRSWLTATAIALKPWADR
jgi:DNA polymerase (family 10)